MDIIVAWPRSCDYPLFRQFIKYHRHYFAKVIVVFTETNQGYNYKAFVKRVMADLDITFLDSPPVKGDQDWRNVAVNEGLEASTANWVWFTEQDVFITDQKFWADIIHKFTKSDAILYSDSGRAHPCMAFVKREVINRTRKDFSVVPDKTDHFAKFFTEIKLMGVEIAWVKSKYFYHMNGLSHNLTLLERGDEITYHDKEFRDYLGMCLDDEVELDNHFIELAELYLV